MAALLGSLLGLERELARKDPSLRTFMLISLGSCTFTILSLHCASELGMVNNDPARIAANVVVGIGFLGAGAIFRARERIKGLTTAALMWLTAAIGMAVGFDRLDIGLKVTLIALTFMIVLNLIHQLIRLIYPEHEDA